MGLRFDPVGGGKFKELVRQLIEIEAQPIKGMEIQRQKEETKLALFREFKSKFSGLGGSLREISDYRKLRELKVELGEGKNLMGVTIDKDRAVPGSYQMEIEDLATRSAMISNSFDDPNDKSMGIGFVVVNLPNGDDWEVFIDDKDSSLRGIAAKINEMKDAPVRAAVVQDAQDPEEKWRLIITAKKDGYFNGVAFPEFYFLDGGKDFWIDQDTESENAIMKIDGFEIEGDGNDINDFLTGVNIHLKQAKPGFTFQMKIDVDYEKVTGKVKSVVDNINEVLKFINIQNTVDENTDTSVTFTGDTSLQSIEYRLRNLMHEGFFAELDEDEEPRLIHLHSLGISFGKDGLLSFNADKFNKIIEDDYDGISEALSGDFGFAYQLQQVLGGYVRPFDGMLAIRERGLESRIDQIDRNIENKERQLEQKTRALTDRFARLQGALGSLQQQQQYLNATLGGTGGNPVSQLLG